MKKHKIAFFDFDDTILPKDSMGRLILFCIKKYPLMVYKLVPIAFFGLLYVLNLVNFIKVKEKILFPLDKLSNEELKIFYNQCLIPNYYHNVISDLLDKKNKGYLIFLVSASPEAYLKYTDLPIDYLIGTQTMIIDGKNTSKIMGKNCKGEEKVIRINKVLQKNNLMIDYENSYGYSDSITDLPMLSLVKNRIRINKKNGSMSQFIKGA